MAASSNMPLVDQYLQSAPSTAAHSTTDEPAAPLTSPAQLKRQLAQLELALARLAVFYGLEYGCLESLAPCFLRIRDTLMRLVQLHGSDGDLVDLAEYLLTDAKEEELHHLTLDLLKLRRHAEQCDPQEFPPAYTSLMNDLLALEQQLQAALRQALGNIAG